MDRHPTDMRRRYPRRGRDRDRDPVFTSMSDESVDQVGLARPRRSREEHIVPHREYVVRLVLSHVPSV